MVKVFLSDILFIESLKDYIRIFRSSEPALVIRQSIALTEAMLANAIYPPEQSINISMVQVSGMRPGFPLQQIKRIYIYLFDT